MPNNELKTLFNNIFNLRFLLKESVGDNTIITAINERKYIYIYYAGDNTVLKGYRTILPMVLGVSKAGNPVLRAWQINGNSDSKKRYSNVEGKYEFGWRLFRVDKITSFLPTGKSVSENKLPPSFNPNDYNPNDSQMTSITAAMQISSKDLMSTGDTTTTKVSGSTFDTQVPKFRQFFQAAAKTRDADAHEIENLYNINKQIRKKNPRNLLVVQNEKGDMVLRDIIDKDKLPPDSIVGNLQDLYTKLVSPTKQPDQSFLLNKEKELQNNNQSINKDFFNKNSTFVK